MRLAVCGSHLVRRITSGSNSMWPHPPVRYHLHMLDDGDSGTVKIILQPSPKLNIRILTVGFETDHFGGVE